MITTSIPLLHYLYLSAFLFSAGLLLVVIQRHTILVLMGIELMLNAANLNFVAFNRYDSTQNGELFALFVMLVAAAEIAVALALLISIYRYVKQVDVSAFDFLRDRQ